MQEIQELTGMIILIKFLGMIRGLSPRPGSWTTLKNGDKEIRMKILKASLFSRSNFK